MKILLRLIVFVTFAIALLRGFLYTNGSASLLEVVLLFSLGGLLAIRSQILFKSKALFAEGRKGTLVFIVFFLPAWLLLTYMGSEAADFSPTAKDAPFFYKMANVTLVILGVALVWFNMQRYIHKRDKTGEIYSSWKKKLSWGQKYDA